VVTVVTAAVMTVVPAMAADNGGSGTERDNGGSGTERDSRDSGSSARNGDSGDKCCDIGDSGNSSASDSGHKL
jgi:hypothetical protein